MSKQLTRKESIFAFVEWCEIQTFTCIWTTLNLHEWLDGFFDNHDYKKLFVAIQKILILSDGNFQVESGFSVNKQFIVENLLENSLIALRMISDHINACKGLSNVKITKEMLDFARCARVLFRATLDRRKVADRRMKQKEEIKRKAKAEFGDIQACCPLPADWNRGQATHGTDERPQNSDWLTAIFD